MTDNTKAGTYSLQTGHAWLIAGLQWQYLPLRGRRNMRLRVRGEDANFWTAILTGEGQAQGTLLGTINITDKHVLKRGRLELASMALTAMSGLPDNCYAVFPLPDGRFWFVAVSEGMLSPFGDIVGDKTAIGTAVKNFLQITPIPEGGWVIYAPEEFFPGLITSEVALTDLLNNKSGIRRARLHKTHDQQALWLWGIAAISILGCYFGYTAWQSHQENIQNAAMQAALIAQQKQQEKAKPTDNLKPWASQPKFPDMLSACSNVWKKAQISIAGWVFNTAECDAKGNITLHYSLPNGGTVGDFAARLPMLYGQKIQSEFNIPGAADDAYFTLPVVMQSPTKPESLLPGSLQIQNLTSYAQRTNAQLRLAELDATTQLSQGEARNVAYRTYSFTFITDIPPDRLFAPTRFDSSGMRAANITTSLKNSRLEYTIEGVLYANR